MPRRCATAAARSASSPVSVIDSPAIGSATACSAPSRSTSSNLKPASTRPSTTPHASLERRRQAAAGCSPPTSPVASTGRGRPGLRPCPGSSCRSVQ
jgi:hypothetical protein